MDTYFAPMTMVCSYRNLFWCSDWLIGGPSSWIMMSFGQDPITLCILLCFLVCQHILDLSNISPPNPKPIISFTGQWILETKSWALSVLTVTKVSLCWVISVDDIRKKLSLYYALSIYLSSINIKIH